MAIVENITADCGSGTLSRNLISRQWDNKGTLIQFAGYPEPEDTEQLIYRLIVWMRESEDAAPAEQAPIELEADQWLISNVYTQFPQTIRFQLCITNEAGTYEKHSPIFSGNVGRSLSHSGEETDIDVSTLFDPYKKYVDELILDSGARVVDTELDEDSDHLVENRAVAGAVAELNERLTPLEDVVYPNQNAVLATVNSFALNNLNVSAELPILTEGHDYRISVQFSADPVPYLSTIRTATGLSGSTIVDVLTDDFEGESWTEGKEAIYTPTAANIKYLRFGFRSDYAKDLTCNIVLYDYEAEQKTISDSLSERIDANASEIKRIDYAINLDDEYNLLPPDGYEVGKTITAAGVIANHATYVLSDYIPIDPSQEYICNWAKTASIVAGNSGMTGTIDCFIRYYFCFFDSEKKVIPYTGDTNIPSKAIPEDAAYIRVCTKSEEAYKIARLIYGNYESQPVIRICEYKKTQQNVYDSPNTGFEDFDMVMFGDSITHGSLTTGNDGVSYVDYANDVLRSKILNVGFGGTRMTYSLTGAGLFCFYHLCECITSNDTTLWDDLVAYATNENATYLPHLQKLMAVDWTKVKAIGLMYGANDYASNTPVGNAYSEDTTKFDGACAYGLKLLLTKYPHLQVIILTPFDREMTSGNPATMTDVQTNSAGLLMSDYADSLENVQGRFHCPLIKTGELFGINQYNILTYAPDGTHPRANIAQKRLGYLFAQAIRNNLAPY